MLNTNVVMNNAGMAYNYNLQISQNTFNLVQMLKQNNFNYWESDKFDFYYGQNSLYIFPKLEKVKNLNFAFQLIATNLTIFPLNNITSINGCLGFFVGGIQIFDAPPSNIEIITFCELMKSKNIFLDLKSSNFINTSMGILIKNPDCFLPRLNIYNILIAPKCPAFHYVVEDFNNGINSDDRLYWCPHCQKHYHKSAINFSHILQLIKEVI